MKSKFGSYCWICSGFLHWSQLFRRGFLMILWEKFFWVSLSIFFTNFQIFREYFFSTQPLKINFALSFNVRELIFYAILTTYQRWFSENFIKICLMLTLKISFEKFGKNIDFRKSPKKFGQNGWREISFFNTFFELLGPKERREGERFPEIWKKMKITAP